MLKNGRLLFQSEVHGTCGASERPDVPSAETPKMAKNVVVLGLALGLL